MSDNRTEKATPKRREDARRKGQIARRAELPAAARFLTALIVLQATGIDFIGRARLFFTEPLAHITSKAELTTSLVHKMMLEAGSNLAFLALPAMAAALAASIASNFAQGGLSFTPEALKPRGERFNPVSNFKNVFSGNSAVELFKNVLKLIGLGLISYSVFAATIERAPMLINSPASNTLKVFGELAYSLGLRTGLVLLLVAALDYGYGWYKHEKSLKMTKQEVKDEYRDQEGDPMVKGQRRRMARSLVQRRMMADIPTADVIITNPTHFAIALRYDKMRDAAPVVIAKGVDSLAHRIRAVAEKHDVTIVENPPLARALYRTVELGQIIPAELFRAVAEVLAYVYRKREEMHL